MMAYPTLCQVSCKDCATYVYDIPSGKLNEFETDEGMMPVVRHDIPTPCDQCPRGGPENEARFQLSHHNMDALLLYEKIHATAGTYRLPDYLEGCQLFAENMRLVKLALDSGRSLAEKVAREQAEKESEQQRMS